MPEPARKKRLEPLLAKGRNASERMRIGAVLAVALAVALLVWLLFLKGGDDSSEPVSTSAMAGKSVSLVPQSGLLEASRVSATRSTGPGPGSKSNTR